MNIILRSLLMRKRNIRRKEVSAEERLDLYEAIKRLPEKYRTAVILKYFDGMKQEEVAYVMGIPRGSVSAYLTRAKRELRKYLKEGYLDE